MAHGLLLTSNMACHETCRHNCTVERRLAVGFCARPPDCKLATANMPHNTDVQSIQSVLCTMIPSRPASQCPIRPDKTSVNVTAVCTVHRRPIIGDSYGGRCWKETSPHCKPATDNMLNHSTDPSNLACAP